MWNRNAPKGQAIIEYALILVLVAMAVIITLAVLGPSIGSALFSQVIAKI